MPYISEEDREHIDKQLRYLGFQAIDIEVWQVADILSKVPSGKTKGAFNYFVTRLWLNTFFPNGDDIGYTSLSDALAVFSDMEHEMRVRIMDKYERRAMKMNGDLPEMIELNQKHEFVRL